MSPTPYAGKPLKRWIWWLLEDPASTAHQWSNGIMSVVVVASVFNMVALADPHLSFAEHAYHLFVDDMFILVFLLEYMLRVWVCSDFTHQFKEGKERAFRRNYRYTMAQLYWAGLVTALRPKLQWMSQPLSIIDMVAILPLFHGLRILRIISVLRLLKLFRYSRRLSFFSGIFRERSYEMVTLLGVAVVSWGLVAAAFYVVERYVNRNVHGFGDAVYWAVISIMTVGYGDITPITPMGKIIAILGVVSGMSVTVIMTSLIVSVLTDRIVVLKEHRMEREIEHLKDHFIICGLAEMGVAVCRFLAGENQKFVGVDLKAERVDDVIRDHVWVALRGDVTEEETWNRLGLARARGVISTIPDDSVNIFLILLVREKRPDCLIVASGATPASEKRLLKVGANRVIAPFQVGGMQMAYAALRPNAMQLLNLAFRRDILELQMEEVVIPHGSVYNSVMLKDSLIRQEFENVIVVGIVAPDGRIEFSPKGGSVLHSGNTLICLGHVDDLERLRKAIEERV
ncbi:MAG: NAD-binding protein [Magnetococcales bacterium]|nr:NAD-binding protein [Magnetococcales bacterium]